MKTLFQSSRFQAVLVSPNDEAELRETFEKFCYEHYVEKLGWEPKNEDGRERDEYSSHSHYLMLFCDGNVVAGCRLIDGRTGSLPVGEKVKVLPNSGEISRYLKKKTAVLTDMRAGCIFYRVIYSAVKELGFSYIYADMREKLFKALKMFSIVSFEQIGEKEAHNDAGPLVPVMLSFDIMKEAYERQMAL